MTHNDRQPKIDKFLFERNQETYTFDVKVDMLLLEFKTALGSPYPDKFNVVMPIPRRMEQTTSKPLMFASKAIFEAGGKTYFAIVAHFDWPVLEGADNIPCIGWAIDPATMQGVARLDTIGQREPSDILGGLAAKILLTKNGKPLGAGSLKTKVGEIDPIEMTQFFEAKVEASGIPTYTITGAAKDLRLAGVRDLQSFKYFTEGQTFSDASSGLSHAVIKDWTGLFHVVSYTGNQIIQETRSKTTDSAFLCIDGLTKAIGSTWKI
jgi:hypothetical protein